MELRQLRYFLAVAETLSFSEAARHVYISQSTLSEQVRMLEDELGSPLFSRQGRRVCLTDFGLAMVEHARATVRSADDCKHLLAELHTAPSGDLYIGVTYTFSTILAETLHQFVTAYPDVRLHVQYASNEELSELLQRRAIDFALAYQNYRHTNVVSTELFSDHLCAIVREDHCLASRPRLAISDLLAYPIILPSVSMRSRQVLDAELARTGQTIRPDMEISDANFLLETVGGSPRLITILASGTIRHHEHLRAIPLSIPDGRVVACLHRLRDDYQKRSATLLMQMLASSPQVQLIRSLHS